MREPRPTFWPKGIALAIFGIILLSIYTVYFALKNPVQDSNDHLTDYRVVDDHINDLIDANIAFNKKYHVEYLGTPIQTHSSVIVYRITTHEGVAVDDVHIEAVLTRPTERRNDIKLELEHTGRGLYQFKAVTLPLEGRWHLFANFVAGEDKGFSQLQLDTRYPNDVQPYGIATPMN